MTALSIQPPFPTIPDIDGQPLEDGYIWIGVANLAPITNPITVYWDVALTLPAVQPVRTLGGYPMNSGTPGRLYAATDYSILVQNKTGSTVYSSANNNGPLFGGTISSVDVTFLQAGTGADTRTAQAKMRDVVSVKDFGAVGNGTADDTAAIQEALASVSSGGAVYFPRGSYKISGLLTIPGGVTVYGDGMMSPNCTSILQTGAAYIFKMNTGCFIRDMYLEGTSAALGAINIDTCGLGEVLRVRIENFTGSGTGFGGGAIAIRMHESYRVRLSYLYVINCFNFLDFSGYVTAFKVDKANISLTNQNGKVFYAPSLAGTTNYDAYFESVYFESCRGANQFFSDAYGFLTLDDCAFEDMCGGTGTITNPRLFHVENPTTLVIKDTRFDGFNTSVYTFSGTCTHIYVGNDAPRLSVDGCFFQQEQSMAGLTFQLVRFFGKSNQLQFTNNRLTGAGLTDLQAQSAIVNGLDLTYTPRLADLSNNQAKTTRYSRRAAFDTAPPIGFGTTSTVITVNAPSVSVWSRTFAGRAFSQNSGFKLTAWGRRTGTAGTKRALLAISDPTPNSWVLSTSTTAANDWRSEAIWLVRENVNQSLSILSTNAAASTTATSVLTSKSNVADLVIEVLLEVADPGDSMTLDGLVFELF